MKIAIFVPAYRDMEIKAINSLIKLVMEVQARGNEVMFSIVNGFNIARQRNKIFEVLQDKEFDYLLTIDSDMVFTPKNLFDLIEKLEDNNLQMLSAMYKIRNMKNDVLAMLREKDGKLQKIENYEDLDGIQVCDSVGMGFCLMKEWFVKDMWNFTDGIPYDINARRRIGEDGYFCKKVKEAGYPVCFDADNKVGHITSIIK